MKRNIVKDLAEKWYNIIGFPTEYDNAFQELLNEKVDLKPMKFEEYDLVGNRSNKGKNLIMFLYFCEELSENYEKKGISYEILLNTIDDFKISVEREYALSGKIGIVRSSVLANHLSMKLFRLGRLQFCMDEIPIDVPRKGLKKGDNVLDIHVPAGGPLKPEECKRDFKAAEDFFAMYFSQFNYSYYMCHSWLLDENLKNFLNENSNILKFQKLFELVHHTEQDSILNFLFKYGLESREEIRNYPAKTDFAKCVKEYALSGGKFYNVIGLRHRKETIC